MYGSSKNRTKRIDHLWNGAPTSSSYIPAVTTQGFTGHEHLDAVGLIHTNGRVYDPVTGRFVSADPLVQAPFSSQSYNRYSYVMNNPMSFVDPSGFTCVPVPLPPIDDVVDGGARPRSGTAACADGWGFAGDSLAALSRYNESSTLAEFGSGLDSRIDRWVESTGYNSWAIGLGVIGRTANQLFVPKTKLDAVLLVMAPLGTVKLIGKVALAVKERKAARAVSGLEDVTNKTGNLTERLGNRELKKIVEDVNKGKLDRDALSPEQRKIAADFFREKSSEVGGKFAKEAAELNRSRADFLEGLIDKVPGQLGR